MLRMQKKKRTAKLCSIVFSAMLAVTMLNGMVTLKAENLSDVSQISDTEKNAKEISEETGYRQVEALDRGLVAIKIGEGVFLSWRYLGTDCENTTFDLYRDGVKINDSAITDRTNYTDSDGALDSKYTVHTLVDGLETEVSEAVAVYDSQAFDILLDKPADGVIPNGTSYSYHPGDASCGDLDGDGEYEIILKWDPSNVGDNMPDGCRGNVYIDAYKLDGTRLWRIDLGANIRAGSHYTQFMVYDFDGDGCSEMVCKTADGTIDGLGNAIGDKDAVWRNDWGVILDGPEYLTLFDGFTGEALDSIPFEAKRGNVSDWGDTFGNRSERYLAAVAYLNGETPSVVMCRGYYTRVTLTAYDIVDKKLKKRWMFDSKDDGNEVYAGQGNHNLATADVDGDGYDEIVYGSCTIDHDGTGLYSSGYGHGDALHVGDLEPEREGLEVWNCIEHAPYGAALRDAKTGEEIFRKTAVGDTGRCVAGNFTKDFPGSEYAYVGSKMLNSKGEEIADWFAKWSNNFVVYWDGDLEQEAMDRTMIEGYGKGRLLTAWGVGYINSSKATSCLSADLLGDWREEVIWPTFDGNNLRVFMTTIPTEYRIATLMHDTQYRCQIASQNVGYNQPAHTSFFLGTGYDLPAQPEVKSVAARVEKKRIAAYDFEKASHGVAVDITGNQNDMTLHGNASLEEDTDKNSAVLKLDGTDGTYASLPTGLFDGLDEFTLHFEVKPEETDGKFFTFTVGKDSNKYLFLKTMDTMCKVAITTGSYSAEETLTPEIDSCKNQWIELSLVMENGKMSLYKERSLIDQTEISFSTEDLGSELESFLGKSFYEGDNYFKGAFDHLELYNYAMTPAQVAKVEHVNLTYEAAEGGNVEGKVEQIIRCSSTGAAVTAVPLDGWEFARWSDGVKTAVRQDENVCADKTVTAIFKKTNTVEKGLIAAYDFEAEYAGFAEDITKQGYLLDLYGSAGVVKDDVKESKVLHLDGNTGTYAQLPAGMFDGMEEWTIVMDVISEMPAASNFFNFAIGTGTDKYFFFKLNDTLAKAAITTASYTAEEMAEVAMTEAKSEWKNVAITMSNGILRLYIDKVLVAENKNLTKNVSDMGEGLSVFFGKSFFSGDAYFNGSYDNIKIYNYALSETEVKEAVKLETVTVTYEAGANGTISGETEQAIVKGSKTQYVEAVPNTGYHFARWSDGNTEAKRRELVVTSDKTLKALFVKNSVNPKGLIAAYDFETMYEGFTEDKAGVGNYMQLYGGATVKADTEKESMVLYLDGTTDTYAAFPQGMFDGLNAWTLRMKVKPELVDGNFFTFAIGKDSANYMYFKTMNTQMKAAILGNGYTKEEIASGGMNACQNQWMDLTVVMSENSMRIYVGTTLVARNDKLTLKTADLGEELYAFLGKSFYRADAYFAGAFDDVEVYNYAWEEKEITGVEKSDRKAIAHFSMDDSENGLTGEGAKAISFGTNEFVEDAERGKVLYLDGTGSNYLSVTKEDGTSLLAGLNQLTVSYYSKSERTDTNWIFFAAEDETEQEYAKERYIGILEKDGSVTAERYLSERKGTVASACEAGWKHVVVVYDLGSIEIYINGTLTAVGENAKRLTDILGTADILQIGKANWGSGEYYKGYIDEMTIYNTALSAKEVAKVVTGEEPFEEETDPNEPTEPGNPTDPGAPTDPGNSNSPSVPSAPADKDAGHKKYIGTKLTVGALSYKVTQCTETVKTVTVTGVKSKKTKLKSITIPATIKYDGMTFNVTEISKNAFKKQTKVTKLTIGKNVEKICANAFNGCSKLKTITFKGKAVKSIGKNAFSKIKKNATFKVPKAKKAAYKKLLKKAKTKNYKVK